MSEFRDEADPDMRDLSGRLPREIPPPKDLWPSIEAVIRQDANEVDGLLQSLPREIPAPDDLWTHVAAGISDRKGEDRNRRTRLWYAAPRLAASIAFVAIVGALLLRASMFDDVAGPMPEQPPERSVEEWLSPSLWNSPDLSTHRVASFEEAHRTYLEQIAAVRRQRDEVESSLEIYPEQPALRELWMHIYETELLLIDEAGRVLTTIQIGWH